jgi:hypothetical protein
MAEGLQNVRPRMHQVETLELRAAALVVLIVGRLISIL